MSEKLSVPENVTLLEAAAIAAARYPDKALFGELPEGRIIVSVEEVIRMSQSDSGFRLALEECAQQGGLPER